MTRSELEHVIRAAGAIANGGEIIVIGSQSILGQFPDAPATLLRSMEADVYPRHDPALSDLIDGAIGEGSLFHETFGYYAQGVDETTAILPDGWRDRLIPINNPNTSGTTGLCLEVHDLAVSKYVAGRERDREFTQTLARCQMTKQGTLLDRLRRAPITNVLRDQIAAVISRDFAAPGDKKPR
jgi:hypothetical protein